MSDPLPPWPEGPRRCPHCGEVMSGRFCRCRLVSSYLRRPLRSYLQARADRIILRIINSRREAQKGPHLHSSISNSPSTTPPAAQSAAALSVRPMSVRLAKPEHEVAYQDLLALVSKHAGKLSSLELLAIAANMLGKLVAMQDQRAIGPARAMEIVARNIEMGNQQVLDQLEQESAGRA